MAKYKVGDILHIQGCVCIVTKDYACIVMKDTKDTKYINLCAKCAWFCKAECIAPCDDEWCPLPEHCYAQRLEGGV